MGKLILRVFLRVSENEKSEASVEGGPLIVEVESDSALMYALLLAGMACSKIGLLRNERTKDGQYVRIRGETDAGFPSALEEVYLAR